MTAQAAKGGLPPLERTGDLTFEKTLNSDITLALAESMGRKPGHNASASLLNRPSEDPGTHTLPVRTAEELLRNLAKTMHSDDSGAGQEGGEVQREQQTKTLLERASKKRRNDPLSHSKRRAELSRLKSTQSQNRRTSVKLDT